MATTAGALSLVSKTNSSVKLSSAAATAGTAPYTYQWHKSTVSGFTPGPGNAIAGATALTLDDTGLTKSTQYFYKVVATDSGAVSNTSAQLAVLTEGGGSPSPNQFAQSVQLGQTDLRYNFNTIPVQIDVSQVGALTPGSAVKIVDSADGIPKVVGCAADSDEVLGFINYDIKSRNYVAGDRAEISSAGNVIYLMATTLIPRGSRVTLDLSSKGGVGVLVGSSGKSIVGWAFDKASVVGELVRIKLSCPSFLKA